MLMAVLQEDERLLELTEIIGAEKWSLIAQDMPGRIGKQCRERSVLPWQI